MLALLLTAALASYFVGQRSDSVIIGLIVALSVGIGLVNEYRAEKAAEALHDQVRHETVATRDSRSQAIVSPLWCPATWSPCDSVMSYPPTSGFQTAIRQALSGVIVMRTAGG